MDPRDYEKELSRRHESERAALVNARTPPDPNALVAKRLNELEIRISRLEQRLEK